MVDEENRLRFIEGRDGKAAAIAFARRTYGQYRECLLLKRRVLDARGQKDRKPHHATFPEYRRGFVESCIVFRRYLRQ
ncbi:MAG: hypothetical protein A3G81_29655 [Betaproteobacteria bacterium RIFCSPLOWO2_12_FULL_65_14]|nr:MAG: hypothetical protein A3G81_29655 [Betaproteobacteria bacterium RIFCSPLOWO2_12_FULL_65_14]